MSTVVADRLYATCMAITDATGNTMILIATDLVGSSDVVFDSIRKQISEETGVPFDQIMVSASHNHSGPDSKDPVYQALLRERIPQPYTAATSNYVGVMRATVEEALDCESLFLLSGSGNVNNNSQILEEIANVENYMELGKQLGQAAIEAAANFQPAEVDVVRTDTAFIDAQGVKGTSGAQLYAFSIGELAFVFAPFEIFDTNAMAVKETSKFPMTLYASCSNDGRGYLPTPPSFDWEITYEADITHYPKGTAENVQAVFIEMLDGLFAAGGYTEQPKAKGYITPAFEPSTDGKEYINLTPGDTTACTQVKNGFYQLTLVDGSKVRVFLALNEEVAHAVLQKTTVKLLFNEQHVIVGLAE